tara:strand:+ start:1489 stop:2118 length:630 start_codon:yes stop_codon:yes gene_type:complete
MQPQPIEYTQPVQYTQPGQYPSPDQYAQPATQYAQPQQPPAQFIQTTQPMMQAGPQQIVYVTQEKAPSKALPWIGVGLIFVSLFLPYVSVLGYGVSGFEMISYMGDLLGFESLSDDGGGGGDSGDALAGIAIIMFMLSPIFFLSSALVSSLVLLVKKSTRIMGGIHLSYAVILIFLGLLMPTGLGFSVFDLVGIGFYMGAFSSGFLLAK